MSWFRVPRVLALAVVTVLGTVVVPSADAASGRGPVVSIPRDEMPHGQAKEWWYFSGHLRGTDPAGHVREYGYEYTTFQFLGEGPAPVYVGNFAVTDLNRKSFQYDAQVDSYAQPQTPDRFDLRTGPWTMRGSGGASRLRAASADYALSLDLRTTKPAALHSPSGIIPYGPFGTSAYYSWTSLTARGTIVDHGVPVRVDGISWMDHQWGDIDFDSGGGWDWFSLQLPGNVQYMLYFIRAADGRVVQTVGTRIGRHGEVTYLPPSTFSHRTLGSWTSPATGITYGSGWTVTVPGGRLSVTPKILDQEVDVRDVQGVAYWEGAVDVRGTIGGKRISGTGYTEINPPIVP